MRPAGRNTFTIKVKRTRRLPLYLTTMLAYLSLDAVHEERKQVLRIFTALLHLIPDTGIVGNTLLEKLDIGCDCLFGEVGAEIALLFAFFDKFPQRVFQFQANRIRGLLIISTLDFYSVMVVNIYPRL